MKKKKSSERRKTKKTCRRSILLVQRWDDFILIKLWRFSCKKKKDFNWNLKICSLISNENWIQGLLSTLTYKIIIIIKIIILLLLFFCKQSLCSEFKMGLSSSSSSSTSTADQPISPKAPFVVKRTINHPLIFPFYF